MFEISKYILQDRLAVPCDDIVDWGKWMGTADRHVAQDSIGDVSISTVFLGIDHQYGTGEPMLFETMIFGGPQDQWCRRYSNWGDAEQGHKEITAKLLASSVKQENV
jgi:hypothetical protein